MHNSTVWFLVGIGVHLKISENTPFCLYIRNNYKYNEFIDKLKNIPEDSILLCNCFFYLMSYISYSYKASFYHNVIKAHLVLGQPVTAVLGGQKRK